MQENSCLKLPRISNQLWCFKNEQHLKMDYNFDHQKSLSKSKCLYSNNCLHFWKRAVPFNNCFERIFLIISCSLCQPAEAGFKPWNLQFCIYCWAIVLLFLPICRILFALLLFYKRGKLIKLICKQFLLLLKVRIY